MLTRNPYIKDLSPVPLRNEADHKAEMAQDHGYPVESDTCWGPDDRGSCDKEPKEVVSYRSIRRG